MTEPEIVTIDKMLSEQENVAQAVAESFAPTPSGDEEDAQ